MWAKYNVDEPGTFSATIKSPWKLYQFNRKTPYPTSGTCTWNITTIDEDSNWTAANDPCPTPWRMPTSAEYSLLRQATRQTDYQAGVGGCLCHSTIVEECSPTATHSLYFAHFNPRSNGDALPPGNEARFWSSSQTSQTHATNYVLKNAVVLVSFNYAKTTAYGVRCVHD
jgi:uncharacterized protein (TIGR02145 family)